MGNNLDSENINTFSEQDICLRYITPAIEKAGWDKVQIRRELTLTAGILRGPPLACKFVHQ